MRQSSAFKRLRTEIPSEKSFRSPSPRLKTEPPSHAFHRPLSSLIGKLESSTKPATSTSHTLYQEPHSIKISLVNHWTNSTQKKTTRKVDNPQQNQEGGNFKYEMIQELSKSPFSTVFKSCSVKNRTKQQAVKCITFPQSRKRQNGELNMLRMLSHPNVIKITDYYQVGVKDMKQLNLVMPIYDGTLLGVSRKGLGKEKIQIYLYQLLQAIAYLHEQNIFHANVHPCNVLINSQKAVLSGFGSASFLSGFYEDVASRCPRTYKAPELLFDSRNLTTAVDMWSFGCCLVEIATGIPLFRSRSYYQQVIQMLKKLGKPSREVMSQINPSYKFSDFQTLPSLKPKPWKDTINSSDPLLLDLIEKLFIYIPSKRITAETALNHPYFASTRKICLQNESEQNGIVREESQCSTTRSITLPPDSPISKLRDLSDITTRKSSKIKRKLF